MSIGSVNTAVQDEEDHITNRDMNKAETLNTFFASVFNILGFLTL